MNSQCLGGISLTIDPSSKSLELFEILFRQHYCKLYQIAYSITRDKELSKDAVQQAFIQVYRKREQLKDKEKFSAWVTTITVNEAKNLIKSSIRLKVVPLADIADGIKTNSVTDSFEHDYIIKDQVERVLNVLSVDDSEILVLRYYSDLTLEEIASILKLTVPNVKIRLYRARANFKEVMSIQDASDDVQLRGESQ